MVRVLASAPERSLRFSSAKTAKVPAVLPAFRGDQTGEIETEADARGIAQAARELVGGWRGGLEGLEERGIRGYGFERDRHAVEQAFANEGPVAQIFSCAPRD